MASGICFYEVLRNLFRVLKNISSIRKSIKNPLEVFVCGGWGGVGGE